jgi:RND family efflux transporter MFP subunit
MKRHFPPGWFVGLCPLAAVLFAGCDKGPGLAETPPPAVTVSQPVEREVVNYDEYEGRLAAVETVEVRARVRGELIKVRFKDGDFVTKGDPLFDIDPRPYKAALAGAEAKKANAEANLKLATNEVERTRGLVAKGAASQFDLEAWIAKRDVSKAEVDQAQSEIDKAKLDLEYAQIKAKIDGRISRALVTEGNLVNTGGGDMLLTTIVTVDPMYVFFNVDERSLIRYREAYRKRLGENDKPVSVKELKIPIEVALEGDESYPHKGVIDFAENQVDPRTGTIQVRGVLPNSKRVLDQGMRARVRVPAGDPYKALLITDRAVGTDQSLKYVYVVDDKNVVKRRDVQLGRMVDGLRVVSKGLNAGDRVIVNGVQWVRPEMSVDPKPGEMPGGGAAAGS